MSKLPLWRDIFSSHLPVNLQEMYPTPIEQDGNPAPLGIAEREMTDAQMKKREEIVKSMKDEKDDFERRYPGRGKEVMYATATKMAMEEDALSEASETFTVMAIDDANPVWKQGGYNYKPNIKVIDQHVNIERNEIVTAAKMLRQKHPNATISVEKKTGTIVKVFKPGQVIKESTNRPIRVGDYVHAGFAVKGGAGFSGRVDKIDGNHVYVNVGKDKSVQFKNDPLQKWGDRIIKAPIKNVSLQEAEHDTKYQEYFRAQLKKHGYDSPADIPDDKKDDFFNAVDKGYNATNESLQLDEKNVPTNPELWSRAKAAAKRKFDVYPSAYANGWAAKWYKKRGGDWRTEEKEAYNLSDPEQREFGTNSLATIYKSSTPGELRESDDQEMALAQLHSIASKSTEVRDMLKDVMIDDIPAWIQDKLSVSDHSISAILDYYESESTDDLNDSVSETPIAESPSSVVEASKDPMVPLRVQAAMVIAKSLGGVKGSGQTADFRVSGSTPESIVNQAIRVWVSGSHTPEAWKLGGQMLKVAKSMGIKWDEKLIRPSTRKAIGLAEADERDVDQARMMRARQLARGDIAAKDDKLNLITSPRMQAAMVIAKSLGSVKGSGQTANFNVSGGTPESIVNQAVRVWLSGSHSNEGWALGAKMLKVAKSMGIKWDEKILKGKLGPITIKKLGLAEADAETIALRNKHKQQATALKLQQAREKMSLRQRKLQQQQARTDPGS